MISDIVIPVFNEEVRLARCMPQLQQFLAKQQPFEWRIVVADNGSTDRTREVAASLQRTYPRIKLLSIAEKGRGGALKHAWFQSDADVLAYMDVDLATGLDALPLLLGTIQSGAADIAVGSRLVAGSQVNRGWCRSFISQSYVLLVRNICGVKISDFQCGFKAISRTAARILLPQVQDSGWFFDTELLIRAKCAGWRVAELPVRWNADDDTRVNVVGTAWRDFVGLCRLRRELRSSITARPIEANRVGLT